MIWRPIDPCMEMIELISLDVQDGCVHLFFLQVAPPSLEDPKEEAVLIGQLRRTEAVEALEPRLRGFMFFVSTPDEAVRSQFPG